MNKNSKNTVIVVVVIIVIVLIIWYAAGSGSNPNNIQPPSGAAAGNQTAPVAVSETTKVSGSSSLYQNAELGFSVKYPTSWEKDETNNGVQFIMPIDQSQVSTVAKLESDIAVSGGKCSFPPVTTVKDRGTLQVGDSTLDMISMSNTVQGRSYFNRMYSLQSGDTCYLFVFSYIALDPATKGLTGSNITQAQNNNKAVMTTADAAFTGMVKTFAFVTAPAGESETQASPAK